MHHLAPPPAIPALPHTPAPAPLQAQRDAAAPHAGSGAGQPLLHFNAAVLQQALAVAAAHTAPGAAPYEQPVGAHLRHVVEHYEALLAAVPTAAPVDYDARARDLQLQRCPHTARQRLQALLGALHTLGPRLQQPLQVRALVGLAGDQAVSLPSTVGRELLFLASHAVHHFALIADTLQARGLALPPGFGVAPATVAHRLATTPVSEETT